MSKTISDSEGNDIEVFTAEELETKNSEAIEAFKKENPDKSEELDILKSELEAKNEAFEKATKDLEAAGDKNQNFAALRKAKEDAEKKAEDANKVLDEKLSATKEEILSSVNKDHFESELARVSAGDEDFQKKVEENYKVLNLPTGTKSEISARVSAAVRLATAEDTDALNTAVVGSGSASFPRGKGGTKEPLPEGAEQLATRLGVTSKDVEKYDK